MNILYQLFISPIEAGMHLVLSATYSATGSYGVSIFLLSLLINVVLLPLFHIAETWQEAERRVQNVLKPKLQEFRKAFSGEERYIMIQTLYRQTGYHPIYAMRSSLGLLLQLPFWIAGYQLLSHYQPLEGVSFLLFEDLGKPDKLLWGINLLPFVMTVVNLVAAFLYTKKLSVIEKIQPLFLALLFLVLLYSSPAGLLLYWTFNSMFSLARIALLKPTQKMQFWQVEPSTSTAQKRLSSSGHVFSTHAGGEGKGDRGGSETFLKRLSEYREKALRLIDLPASVNVALFLVVVVFQLSVHVDLLAYQGGLLDKHHLASMTVIGVSIVILVYRCLVHSLKNLRGGEWGLRRKLNITLVWLLLAALVMVNVAWLSASDLVRHPARDAGSILLLLLVLLFASPILDGLRILKQMPDSHWLYTTSASLTAFVLFVANPVSLYVSSGDFVGGVYGVAGTLLVYFVAVVLALTTLYILMDKTARKGLTLLSVFSAFSVIVYSAMGVKDAGIMTQFILPLPGGLIRTTYEIVAEIATLVMLLGATSYAAINYRQNVTRVVGVMLVTSICVAAADIYGAKGDAIAVSNELPVNATDLVSFSRERNVLIIMLDGFPGGYIQRIKKEAPETLKPYEGFVWYPNTLSTNSDTLGSIATLAGGPRYTVHEMNNRNEGSVGSAINESYSVYPDAFIPKDYQVTYVNPAFAGGCDRLDKRMHCTDTAPYGIYYHIKEDPDAPMLQGDSHVPLILTIISLFKASPFFLKSWIYDDGRYRGSNSEMLRLMTANTLKAREWGFLRVLARERNADSKSKTFKFIQLSIPHVPNAFDDDCRLQPATATVLTEAVCALKEIGVLLAWLKDNGIYDATKIVLVSDHGWYVDNPMFPRDFEKTVPKGDGWLSIPGVAQPLLLVKDFSAKGDIRRSDTFLSNSDVPSIVCSTVGGCRGVGPDPITNSLGERRIIFTMTAWPPDEEKAKKLDIMESYEVTNNIFDAENWKRVK